MSIPPHQFRLRIWNIDCAELLVSEAMLRLEKGVETLSKHPGTSFESEHTGRCDGTKQKLGVGRKQD